MQLLLLYLLYHFCLISVHFNRGLSSFEKPAKVIVFLPNYSVDVYVLVPFFNCSTHVPPSLVIPNKPLCEKIRAPMVLVIFRE